MPTELNNTSENRMDERSNSIKSNPCGICRALGLPICKGHGGGGGGGGADTQNDDAPELSHVPSNIEVITLSSYLENSEVWNYIEDFKYHFKSELAIFSILLDLGIGLIHFKGNELLNDTDNKDLNALYSTIESEFRNFSQEVHLQDGSAKRTGNDLKISIPDPKLYDQFVTRLINKNLIPNNNYNVDLANKTNQNPGLSVYGNGPIAYKTPNPFDISRGPKPGTDPKE
ncbi:TPA: hypothetical protein ACGWTM_001744 [Legionella pneumophila]